MFKNMWLPSMTLIELKVMMMIADARVIDYLYVLMTNECLLFKI